MWVSDDVSLSSAQPTTEPGAGLSLAEGKPPEAVYRVDIIDALRSILEANSRLLDADDFDAGVMEWIKTITLTFGAHAGISALLEAAGDEFVPVDYPYLWVTPEHPAPAAFTMSVPRTRQFSDWDRRLADGETICANIRDLEEDESRAFWERTACRSNIIVPVNIDNGRRSFFGLDFAEEQLFDEEVVEAVRSAAYGLAGALRRHALNRELIETERQRAFEAKQSLAERERRNELLRAVVAMSEVLVAARALEDAAPTVLKRLGEALALDHSFIGVLDPKENATPGRSSPLRTLSSWTCPNFEMRPDRRVAEIDRFFPAFDRLRLGDFVVGAPPATDTFERSTGAQYLCPIMIDQELWGVLVGTDRQHGVSAMIATYSPNQSRAANQKPSSLAIALRDAAWIPAKDGSLRQPRSITAAELAAGYSLGGNEAWLQAVGFGEEQRKRSDQHRARLKAAELIGLSAELVDQLEGLPAEALAALNEDLARKLATRAYEQVEFPERETRDPGRRAQRLAARAQSAPAKAYEVRERSVRTSNGETRAVARTYLEDHYTNPLGDMICQGCHQKMPFALPDGSPYFEASELLECLPTEHAENHLAMCPTCAAKWLYANPTTDAELRELIAVASSPEIDVILAGKPVRLRFTQVHLDDVQTVIGISKAT